MLNVVTVLLQAMKDDPPLDAKCKDKFLVQSIAITPERESGSVQSIVWHGLTLWEILLTVFPVVQRGKSRKRPD